MARAIQGTATNNTSTQTTTQRSAFGNEYGINSSAAALFSGFDGAAIDLAANDLFKMTVSANIPASENPDFNGGVTSAVLHGFSKGDNKFENLGAAADKPNVFGPNLNVIDIDGTIPQNGTPAITDLQQAGSVTALQSGAERPSGTDASYETNGYGIDISRNDPRGQVGISASYIDRRSSSNKLGEYIDSSAYEYSNVNLDD